jgi:hypothetical protein
MFIGSNVHHIKANDKMAACLSSNQPSARTVVCYAVCKARDCLTDCLGMEGILLVSSYTAASVSVMKQKSHSPRGIGEDVAPNESRRIWHWWVAQTISFPELY